MINRTIGHGEDAHSTTAKRILEPLNEMLMNLPLGEDWRDCH